MKKISNELTEVVTGGGQLNKFPDLLTEGVLPKQVYEWKITSSDVKTNGGCNVPYSYDCSCSHIASRHG